MAVGIQVHAFDEGIEVGFERRPLLIVPLTGPARNSHGADITIVVPVAGSEVLGGSSSSFGVELEDQVRVTRHLGVAQGLEDPGVISRVDVGHAPGIPEDLRRGLASWPAPEHGHPHNRSHEPAGTTTRTIHWDWHRVS